MELPGETKTWDVYVEFDVGDVTHTVHVVQVGHTPEQAAQASEETWAKMPNTKLRKITCYRTSSASVVFPRE